MMYIEAYIIKHGGPGVRNMYKFGVISDVRIGTSQAQQIQKLFGYDPLGYDFHTFECEVDNQLANRYISTWYCNGSCE